MTPEPKKLDPRVAALFALVVIDGLTVKDAAARVGLERSTAQRRVKDAALRRQWEAEQRAEREAEEARRKAEEKDRRETVQSEAIEAVLNGRAVIEVAREQGVSPSTVYRWMKDRDLSARAGELRPHVEALLALRATAASVQAVAHLAEMVGSPGVLPIDRVKAADVLRKYVVDLREAAKASSATTNVTALGNNVQVNAGVDMSVVERLVAALQAAVQDETTPRAAIPAKVVGALESNP